MIKWHLKKVMADRGIWTAQELLALIERKAGIILSHSAVASLTRQQPRAIRFTTLEALCLALECSPWEIMEYIPEKRASRKRIVAGEGVEPIAPYKRKSAVKPKESLYPEEDF